MADYKKVCWYCGGKDLSDLISHIRCRNCGTTYNDVPTLGVDPLASHGYYTHDSRGNILVHACQPSKRAKRQAKSARSRARG